jgi:hypothetical protein
MTLVIFTKSIDKGVSIGGFAGIRYFKKKLKSGKGYKDENNR